MPCVCRVKRLKKLVSRYATSFFLNFKERIGFYIDNYSLFILQLSKYQCFALSLISVNYG